jgi:transglutaminase-like putative cysteine protease
MNTIAQVCDLWEAIYANWSNVRDPPDFNYYLPASDSIMNGLKGNCVDYAILNAAVIASIGGKARVVIAYDSQGNGHAYPEVYLGDSIEEL